MEGAGNLGTCSPLLRALVLITIALAAIPYADADCTTPPTDSGATVSPAGKTSWTPGETVAYICNANFQVVTATNPSNTYNRICSGTTWALPSPSGCEATACRTVPPVLPNADASPNTNNQVLAAVVTYTCTSGNIIAAGVTTFTYTCQLKSGTTYEAEWAWTTGQAVQNPVCAAPVCPATAPTEANAIAGSPTSGTASGSTITYTCNNVYQVVSGTTASQTFTRTCTSGAWAAASPAGCTVLKCLTAPPTDTNAAASTVTTPAALDTTVTYTCNTNYVVAIGDPGYVRICKQKSGSTFEAEWVLNTGEPATATCIAFGCSTTATAMNFATAGTVTLPSTGGEVTYTCNTGYQAVTGTTAAPSFKATCVVTTWTPSVAAGCTVNKCLTQPSTDANAPTPAVSLPANLGVTWTYTCNTNFVVAVGDPGYNRICAATTTTYEAAWKLQSGEPAGATCVAVMCTTASIPATDTNATPGTPSSTTVGGTVTYTCKTGFQVIPATGTTPTATYTRACSSSGWGVPSPAICSAIECLTVPPTDAGAPAPPASTAPAVLNTVYTYTCSANFVVAIGDTSYARICKQKSGSTFEGEWALNTGGLTTAKCVAYNCASAVAPSARTNAATGTVSLTNGGQVTYTCNANNQYVAASSTTGAASFTIICTSNAWPTTPTGCTATACLIAPPTESNAPAPSITLPAAANSESTYTCNLGYVVAVADNTYIKVCQITSSASYTATWVLKATEPTGATCSAFSCPTTAPARDNAVAGTIITSSGGSITYTCKSGNEYKVGSTITSTFTIKCANSAWPSSPTGCTRRSLRGWEIALIVIGVLLVVAGIILIGCLCWWYNKNKAADPNDLRQLQVDRRKQNYDYQYGPGAVVPPYSRERPVGSPFQPYSIRPSEATMYDPRNNYNLILDRKPGY